MKRAEPDDLWPKPQYYSIYCPVCGRPAARLVYQAPVARYMAGRGLSGTGWYWKELRIDHAAERGARAPDGPVSEGTE